MFDLKLAVRSLLKTPGFAVITILTLAVGIGANTAIFSAVYRLFLKPLPYEASAELVSVRAMVQRDEWERRGFSVPDFHDYRRLAQTTIASFSAYRPTTLSLTGEGDAERIGAETVTHDYFATLGVRPVRGRFFDVSEDSAGSSANVAVISARLWDSRFGGDPEIVGRTVRFNEVPFEIVGVAPRDFHGLTDGADAWVTLTRLAAITNPRLTTSRGFRWLDAVARIRPGADPAQVRAELATVAAQLANEHPSTNAGYGADIAPLRDELFGDMRGPLALLMGAVALLLVITCANVANLLLVRLSSRANEIAVRSALGASRFQLMRLIFSEAAVIAACGAVAGTIGAVWLIEGIMILAPVDLPGFAVPRLEAAVLGFAGALAGTCAALICVVPLFFLNRAVTSGNLKESGRGTTDGQATTRVRSALVGAEIALSFALLTGSVLIVGSFWRMENLPTGFRTSSLITAQIVPPAARYDAERAPEFRRRLLAELESISGVQSVALSSDTPLGGDSGASFIALEGESEASPELAARVYRHSVTRGFFKATGISLMHGEDIPESSPPGADLVVVVSESLARRFGPGDAALGKRLKFGQPGADRPWSRIIGIVADTRYRGIPANPTNDPDAYFPFDQVPSTITNIVIHSRTPGAVTAAEIRDVVAGIDPLLPVSNVGTIESRIDAALARQRFASTLMSLFGMSALALTLIGLFGVVSYSVGQRTKEIGIRIALGARPAHIVRLFLGGTGRLFAFGLGAGVPLTIFAMSAYGGLLFEFEAFDPLVYSAVAILMFAIGCLAAWLPTRRATRVDPITALRAE